MKFYPITLYLLISLGGCLRPPGGVVPTIDISSQSWRHSIVAAGDEETYQGHPTTVLMGDGTLLCVWTRGHGGSCGPMAKSNDGGRTWETVETPEDWSSMENCPCIYRMEDKSGQERLMIFAARPAMSRTYSNDGGQTWTPVESLGIETIMPFTGMIRLKNGDWLGMYNRRPEGVVSPPQNELWQSVSHDGGLSWGEPERVLPVSEDAYPCEPYIIRSPNGKQLACLIRENKRKGKSLVMFSDDEGTTWSEPQETPWGLSGDRHVAKYAPDGRMVVVFRDVAPLSPTKNHFVAWVGHYRDLIRGTGGEYRVKLLHSYAGWDCGYPGLEVLEDGTFVATTYIKYGEGTERNSVISLRFGLDELDEIFRTL